MTNKLEWDMMKEDIAELRKVFQKYPKKNALILQESIDNDCESEQVLVKKLYFKEGMKGFIEKLLKVKCGVIDLIDDRISKTAIKVNTNNNIYYLLYYSKMEEIL